MINLSIDFAAGQALRFDDSLPLIPNWMTPPLMAYGLPFPLASLWADPRLVYSVAVIAVVLLIATVWLFRRQRKQGRQAGMICLVGSISLHIALVFLIPMLPKPQGGHLAQSNDDDDAIGIDAIAFSSFDPKMKMADQSSESDQPMIAPLPIADLAEMLHPPLTEPLRSDQNAEAEPTESLSESLSEPLSESDKESPPSDASLPQSLADATPTAVQDLLSSLEADFRNLEITPEPEPQVAESAIESDSDAMRDESNAPEDAVANDAPVSDAPVSEAPISDAPVSDAPEPNRQSVQAHTASASTAVSAAVTGEIENDFANRVGEAKRIALLQTGGSVETEAAVAAALRYLTSVQRADGAWDPFTSGAGKERQPLGMARGNAGSRAETAITGLALLSLMGAGHTHQQGDYAENVYRGLAYLIMNQKPNGSLAGGASVYEATYCHGMAALAMAEAAAITADPSAVASATLAIKYTRAMQHPVTGGWRYTAGDPGDLSQLGWQAMVLDAGSRAGIPAGDAAVRGIERYLFSVRAGRHGGLASYRVGEASSRTMTAEALATRLLIGQTVPAAEIAEAQQSMLQQKPGSGQDNYYYWYYATIALHQLQDDAWEEWNTALKHRLLSTQNHRGEWPTNSVWGGYGGSVYTTAMATLCLESYYRHTIRNNNAKIAAQPESRFR